MREDSEGTSDFGLYGDFVEELDWSTGQVLDALEDMGIRGIAPRSIFLRWV